MLASASEQYHHLIKSRNHLLRQRAIAFTIDLLFITWVYFALQQAFINFWEDHAAYLTPDLLQKISKEFIIFGMTLRYGLWVAYMTMATYITGTSLGKFLCGLKVVDQEDAARELAFWQCFNRALTYPLYWFMFPIIIPFLNDEGKSLGDYAGQTKVVAAEDKQAAIITIKDRSAA